MKGCQFDAAVEARLESFDDTRAQDGFSTANDDLGNDEDAGNGDQQKNDDSHQDSIPLAMCPGIVLLLDGVESFCHGNDLSLGG